MPSRLRPAPDDAARARYRATTEPAQIVVREGERPAPVTLGAGALPPAVVTTSTGTSLVMIARVDPPQAPAGAEVSEHALVIGAANDVVDLPLASLDAVRVVPGRDYDLAVGTRFRTMSVRVRIGADVVELASRDGYQWHGAWRADAAIAGTVEAVIVVDDEELVREAFEVPSAE